MIRRPLIHALLIGLASSCASVAPAVSRIGSPEALRLGEAKIRSTGLIAMTVAPFMFGKEFLPAGFVVEAGGKRLYVDPVAPRDPLPADYILVTHPHGDHFWIPSLKAVAGAATVLICPAGMAERAAKATGLAVKGLAPGEVLELDGLVVQAYPAYTLKAGPLGFNAHPRSEGYLAYRFEFGGASFFHTGDSNDVPEFSAVRDLDLLFLPIDGGGLSMGTDEAAALANRLKPRFAVPMHYASREEFERLKGLLDPAIEVADLR